MGCAGCGQKYRSYPRVSTAPTVRFRPRVGRRTIGAAYTPPIAPPPAEIPTAPEAPTSDDTVTPKVPSEG